ncbi:craniofacial development protein 2-like [Teleopsis dalmanni]|uniref:craniofacial development protein 2-like n=1 Tax=Teleopsis dalmanni TaxID=139649 RepID=UPI0018CF83D3|nr:craniofacial development protein 2-like [Teleopsis dalmanni]
MPNENDLHQYGVGILLNAKFRDSIKVSFEKYIGCSEDVNENDKDAFYDKLSAAIAEAPKKDFKIVMDDVNAKIGEVNENLEHVIGKHGLGDMNDNGERLVEICGINELKLEARFSRIKQYIK